MSALVISRSSRVILGDVGVSQNEAYCLRFESIENYIWPC
jgi:hypothetical protein